MRMLLFLGLWTLTCAGGAALLWKISGSRKKIYGLILINMIYLEVIFRGYALLAKGW